MTPHMYTAVYMLAADAAVAAAVFGLEHLISYCNHTKRCFGPISRRRHSRGERESLHSPQLDRERDAAHARASVCTLLLHAPGVLSPVCGSTLRVSHDMTIKGNTEYIRT